MPDFLTVTMNPAVDVFTSTAAVVPTHKLRCEPVQVHPGGGGVNVARVLHRFGADCVALLPAGGATGEHLCHMLADERVPTRCIRTAQPTRENFSVRDRGSAAEYRFVLPGPTLSEGEWKACLDALNDYDPPPRDVIASGSLPPGVPDHFYALLARHAHALGARVALDASGASLAAGLQAGVDIVKPSLRELRQFTGRLLASEPQWTAAAMDLVREGHAACVALSLGELGALLVDREGAWRAPALSVEVAGTIGAGDSFLAGLVWAYSQGLPSPEALREAMAAASASLQCGGTGLCRMEDVQRLRGQVRVVPV